jgi:hypothetical protein
VLWWKQQHFCPHSPTVLHEWMWPYSRQYQRLSDMRAVRISLKPIIFPIPEHLWLQPLYKDKITSLREVVSSDKTSRKQ